MKSRCRKKVILHTARKMKNIGDFMSEKNARRRERRNIFKILKKERKNKPINLEIGSQ